MIYVIMCGGTYNKWTAPRHLIELNGESVVARTIRLLRENGVEDIYISANDPLFENLGVPVLKHKNDYAETIVEGVKGYWVDAFYPLDEPACYLFGDVVFSPSAIRTIVNTETEDIEYFASAPPFSEIYQKEWAEPFALKVVNQEHLKEAIRVTKFCADNKLCYRKPIMWELWQVIKQTPLNQIDYTNYTAINDYTCDIDYPQDVEFFKGVING